ncbi:MAG: hypothetical protein M3P91_11950 [Actinomycetota bacterium]|nr:hypothetical protein [Actinomycetota bacterium]
MVIGWLAAYGGLNITRDRWAQDYGQYVRTLTAWALQLDVPPADVEYLIFRSSRAGARSSAFHEGNAGTAAGIETDLRAAMSELDRLGTAGDQAKAHIMAALGQLRRL